MTNSRKIQKFTLRRLSPSTDRLFPSTDRFFPPFNVFYYPTLSLCHQIGNIGRREVWSLVIQQLLLTEICPSSSNRNQPLTSTMKAMVTKKCWFSSILELQEVNMPEIEDNEVMIKVCAVGVNRGDIIDVATCHDGFCPGLECSGIIEAVGRNVNRWKVGERVCAILEGGGYAEQVAVPADFLLPLPDDIDLDAAAGLPYASCSIWLALFEGCDLKTLEDKTILIREGTSGIGTLAIQYAKYMGLKVIASTGSRDKFSICRGYGADFCVDHTSTSYVAAVLKATECKGVDIVLDYGASDFGRSFECCGTNSKLVIMDLPGLTHININFARLQRKQTAIKVIDLRSRDLHCKASTIAKLRTYLWPAILQQKAVPAIEYKFPVIEAQKALNLLEENESIGIGKIIAYMNSARAPIHHLKTDNESIVEKVIAYMHSLRASIPHVKMN